MPLSLSNYRAVITSRAMRMVADVTYFVAGAQTTIASIDRVISAPFDLTQSTRFISVGIIVVFETTSPGNSSLAPTATCRPT
jgi:hypothetical protein